jgi:hypothetical protein
MIKITLNQIRAHDPCADGWAKVLKAQGGKKADLDSPFPVSSILDSNGLDDMLWVLQCLPRHDNLWRLFAVWCARQVQHLMTDPRSTEALDVAERHAKGLATDQELGAAADAAWAAVGAARDAWAAVWGAWDARAAMKAAWDAMAEWDAARAAWDAAWNAAGDARAAWNAARCAGYAAGSTAGSDVDAAWDAARAAMREKQAAKLRQILDAGEWVDGGEM